MTTNEQIEQVLNRTEWKIEHRTKWSSFIAFPYRGNGKIEHAWTIVPMDRQTAEWLFDALKRKQAAFADWQPNNERNTMIGGTVIETIEAQDKVWINCREEKSGDKCAIYVAKDAKSRTVAEGDSVWWQGRKAMWTPKGFHPNGRSGIDFDIRLNRIGYSGANRPYANTQ